jgi:CelD/BcsL family acetyltransferase involved in cellulose biosynthesis
MAMCTTLERQVPPSQGGANKRYETRVLATRADLTRFERAWRSLGDIAPASGPIEQFDWAATCAAWGPSDRQLRIVALSRNDHLVGLLPLELKRTPGAARLVLLGADELFEPMGLLVGDAAALKQLATSLATQRRPVFFDRLVIDEEDLNTLRAELGEHGIVVVRPQAGYPWIPLDASWQEPEAHLNSGRRSDLRRARRRAEKLGDVTSEVLTPRPEELDGLLDEAFAVESRSWKGREGTALAHDASRAAFYRQYAHAVCRQGSLRMCFLRIAGQAVAMQIAVVQGGGFWLLKIGYDADFAGCSPGMLLLRDSIAYAANAGLRSFEFLGQSEPWIAIWTDRLRPCVSLRMYPYNLRGARALAADGAAKFSSLAADKTRRAASGLRGAAKRCVLPVVNRAARAYVAGNTLDDALRVKERLASQGIESTIGYWDSEADEARAVADQYLAGLDALAGSTDESYLSIKLPAMRFSRELLRETVERAGAKGRRMHFDAMAPDTVDRTWEMIEEVVRAVPTARIGCTLPGRWARSLEDARRAVERGLAVRVVKGQWADSRTPDGDLRQGFLEVIEQLAGRASSVSVATHDIGLAAEALGRLQAAGTPCDLELLYGLPMRRARKIASQLGVKVRVYIPYGDAYLPYALSQARRRPRILWWLLRDAAKALVGR